MSKKLKPVSTIIMDFGLEEYGEGHNYFASRCMARMDKYVPMDSGTLSQEAYVDAQCNIHYDQEYASYQYYGQRKDGSHIITNRTTDKHPLASSYWDKQMLSAEKDLLVKDMQEYISKRGNK